MQVCPARDFFFPRQKRGWLPYTCRRTHIYIHILVILYTHILRLQILILIQEVQTFIQKAKSKWACISAHEYVDIRYVCTNFQCYVKVSVQYLDTCANFTNYLQILYYVFICKHIGICTRLFTQKALSFSLSLKSDLTHTHTHKSDVSVSITAVLHAH